MTIIDPHPTSPPRSDSELPALPAVRGGRAPAPLPVQPPRRWGWPVWVAGIVAFLGSYICLFAFVHVAVDTRACLTPLPDDPLMKLIPASEGPLFVTHTLYFWFTTLATLALAAQAVRGRHEPLLRWGIGLSLQAGLRSVTMLLLPLCRIELAPGTVPFAVAPTLDLGFAKIPWRMWGTNDLVFSGHVGEFFLLSLATRHWPRPVRVLLVAFQIAQAYSLIATRGHYTIDIVVAIPFAFFADAIACWLLDRAHRSFGRPRAALAVAA